MLRSFRALVKSNDARFVSLLVQQAELAVNTLQMLHAVAANGDSPEAAVVAIKENERAGDELRRVLIDELMHTYATPFDREDLFELSRLIDDILDAANETITELSIYAIEPSESFTEMTQVLVDGARHVYAAVSELLDHPGVAAEHAVRAKRSENRIDFHYHRAIRRILDSSNTDIHQALRAREIYRHLKNSADLIDRTADKVSLIVIKRA